MSFAVPLYLHNNSTLYHLFSLLFIDNPIPLRMNPTLLLTVFFFLFQNYNLHKNLKNTYKCDMIIKDKANYWILDQIIDAEFEDIK